MLPIILGVLIALLINNWNQSRLDKKFEKTVLNSIKNELTENLEELNAVIPDHHKLVDTISLYQFDEDVSIGQILNKVKGIQSASIKNTSWKSILNSNIQLFEYDLLTQLINIDEGKADHKMLANKLLDLIYDSLEKKDVVSKQKFSIVINDFISVEDDLRKSHEACLLQLKFDLE